MKEIDNDPDLELQVIATGMHLSPEFGLTYREIERDGFKINRKVEMLLSSDTEVGVTKAIGLGCIGFADALYDLKPDILVLLGDRFEILSAAIAAMVAKIPIAHIHGGESTEGAFDEQIRHAITKMANIHFPVTDQYAKKIIQMGESPDLVFNYGAPGLDNIYRLSLMTKPELEKSLGFKFGEKTALVTYHPVTLEINSAEEQIINLLEAVKEFNLKVIFTKANADTYGRVINQKIEEFVKTNPEQYRLFESLGQIRYLSTLKYIDLMIGNSSSGLLETPSFKLPVVNIGDRQKGRIRAKNVIDVGYSKEEIKRGIEKALSVEFANYISDLINPYDKYADGKVSWRIKEKLKEIDLSNGLIKKSFFDI